MNRSLNILGKTITAVLDKDEENYSVNLHSVNLAQFLATFGKYAYNKNLPPWVITLPINKQKSFLKGYLKGDGFRDEDGQRIGAASTSLNLIIGIRSMLHRLNIFPSFLMETAESMNTHTNIVNGHEIKANHDIYKLEFYGASAQKLSEELNWEINPEIKTYRWKRWKPVFHDLTMYYAIPIKKSISYDVKDMLVYNLKVANDNSYVTDAFTLHNCGKDSQWVPVDGFGPLLYLENVSVGTSRGSSYWANLLNEYIKQNTEVIIGKRKKEQIFIPEIHGGSSEVKHFCLLTSYLPSEIESQMLHGTDAKPTHDSVWDSANGKWTVVEKKGLYDR